MYLEYSKVRSLYLSQQVLHQIRQIDDLSKAQASFEVEKSYPYFP